MRRTVSVVSFVLASLSLAAPARADVLTTYSELAGRILSPAPLVPTTVPPILSPLDRTLSTEGTRGGRGYSLRLVHYNGSGPDAIIVVTGGESRTMKRFLRENKRGGFKRKPTRVRGHRGYVLTRKLGPTTRTLAWVERGVVYSVGSGTPKKISLANLRATANALDRIGRDYIGGSSNPESSSEGFAFTTARTITARVSFEAACAGASARVGQAAVTLARRQGNSFAFDIGDNLISDEPWDGTVTGTISASAVTLTVQASATIEGAACDSGTQTLVLGDHFQLTAP